MNRHPEHLRAAASERIAAILLERPIVVLALYFLVQALIRTWLGAPPNLDEAEQFAIADRFAFGYGPHPPLYQWLQTAAFGIFGVNFLAIALLKNALLFGTWAMLWALGFKITGDRKLAAIAGFGPILSPNFAWESQIDHTHTVSNTFLAVLATYWMFCLLERRTPWLYLALGFTIGLGLVAKYNFVIFLVAVVIAFASDRKARSVILSRWFVPCLLVAVAVALPHYLYILDNPVAGTAKISELGLNRLSFLATRIQGLNGFLAAILGVHGLWLAVVALGFIDRWLAPREPASGIPADRQHAAILLVRLWLLLFLAFLGLVLVGGTTNFRDHWLQPEAAFFPLVLAIVFARSIDAIAFRRLALAVAVLLVAIPVAVIANKRLFPGAQRDAAMPDPAAVAAAIGTDGGAPARLVIAGGSSKVRWFAAGHLRHWLQIPVPQHDSLVDLSGEAPLVILFNDGSGDPKRALAGLLGAEASDFSDPRPIAHFRPSESPADAGSWHYVRR